MNNGWIKSVLIAAGSTFRRGYVWLEVVDKSVNLDGNSYQLSKLISVLKDKYGISNPKFLDHKPNKIKIYGGKELKY